MQTCKKNLRCQYPDFAPNWLNSWKSLYCSQMCKGHCREGITCNHVTGICIKGCPNGWTELKCEKGKWLNQYCWLKFFLN